MDSAAEMNASRPVCIFSCSSSCPAPAACAAWTCANVADAKSFRADWFFLPFSVVMSRVAPFSLTASLTFFNASWNLMSALLLAITVSPYVLMPLMTSSMDGTIWSVPSFALRIAASSCDVPPAAACAFGSIWPSAIASRVLSSAVNPICFATSFRWDLKSGIELIRSIMLLLVPFVISDDSFLNCATASSVDMPDSAFPVVSRASFVRCRSERVSAPNAPATPSAKDAKCCCTDDHTDGREMSARACEYSCKEYLPLSKSRLFITDPPWASAVDISSTDTPVRLTSSP